MGDISELRTIITLGTFLGVLIFLIACIPPAFLIPDYEGKTIETPEYFEAIEITKYASTWNYTFDGSDITKENPSAYIKRKEIGGHTFYFYYAKPNKTINGIFWVGHITYWWIFETGHHRMDIWNSGVYKGTSLDRTELDDDYTERDDLTYTFQCQHTQLDIFFAFNETTYSTPSEAFDGQELKMLIGIEWSQIDTSVSAWDIIGMVLFFQLPTVHWAINALIAIPIWLGMAYVAFILILRTIGAIFGGGA